MKSRLADGRLQAWVTAGYLGAMATVFLLFWGFEGYGNITTPKFWAFCILSGVYVAFMAALAAARVIFGLTKKPWGECLRHASPAQWAAIAYAGITWASAICSPYWPDTLWGISRYEGAATITLYVAVFLLVSVYGRPGRWLLWALAGAVTLFSALCLVQLSGFNPFGLYPQGYSYLDAGKAYAGAYLGTLGNVDLVAAFFSLVIPLLFYLLLRQKDLSRFLLLVPLGLSLWAAAWMGVSAGYLGIGAGCALAFPIAGATEKKHRAAAGALLGGALVLGLALVFFWDAGGGMLHEAHQMLHGEFDGRFGSGRVHIWQEVLQKLPGHLLLGYGPDTMLRAGLTPFTRYDAALGGTVVGHIDVAHNEYLNVLFHQGLMALAAYLAMLATLFYRWMHTAKTNTTAAALGAGTLGYCVQALFGFSMCITAPFFWLALALLESSCKRATAPVPPQNGKNLFRPPRLPRG